MECFVKVCENNEGEQNWTSFFLRAIIMIIPIIIDIILTAISFDEKIQTYFILRFISYLFNIFFCISASYFSSYENSDGIDAIPHCILIMVSSCLFAGLEIPCLVFFIKYYDNIELLGKVAYYIHLSLFPCLIVNFCINRIIKNKDDY